MAVLKALFQIENNGSASGHQAGWITIGPRYCVLCAGSEAELTNLLYLEREAAGSWTLAELDEVYVFFSEKLSLLNDLTVSYDFPGYQLLPGKAAVPSAFDQVIGISDSIQTIPVATWQLQVVHAVPQTVKEWVDKKIRPRRELHSSISLLQQLRAGEEAGMILLNVGTDQCTVLAGKAGALLLVQSFEWTTAEDILYYLLKLVHTFNLSQQEAVLLISGLVDTDSALYKELYQYFAQIELRTCNWQTGAYPAHFFTALNDLARCE